MRNLIYDYWDNFDRTFFGNKWGKDLTVYLEQKMADKECDHTFKYTNDFFSKRFSIKRIYQLWIYNHYCCDCEIIINTNWRDGLDWRSEPEEFKVNNLDNYLIYRDGTKLDLRLYKNGLKQGNILKLIKEIPVKDLDGNLLNTITRGTLFRVLPMEYSSWDFGKVQLVSMGDPVESLRYDDDEKIFEEMELLDAVKYYEGLIDQFEIKNNKVSLLYKSIALAHKNEDKIDHSLRWYKKAVEKSIQESGLNSGVTFLCKKDLANEYFDQGKYELAISLFEEAVKLNTGDQTHTSYTKNFKEKIKIANKILKEQDNQKNSKHT